jgi:hypothetical protein
MEVADGRWKKEPGGSKRGVVVHGRRMDLPRVKGVGESRLAGEKKTFIREIKTWKLGL